MSEIVIKTETIRLSQFLKLANAVQDGVEAKFLIQDGVVKVNGEVETRRGRKLRPGDMVEVHAAIYRIVFKDNE
jgi:ribosome-associated protein